MPRDERVSLCARHFSIPSLLQPKHSPMIRQWFTPPAKNRSPVGNRRLGLTFSTPSQMERNMSFRFYASATEPRPKLKSVVGPRGDLLLLCDLPCADHERWTARNKLEVVAAVRGGLLSLAEARSRYRMSDEEFRTWEIGASKRIHRQTTPRPMICPDGVSPD
jgi:hypothetical protein